MAFFGENGCAVWVRFKGTGTVSINDDFNVTSITDNGTGDYRVNFSSSLSNTSYCVLVGGQRPDTSADPNHQSTVYGGQNSSVFQTGSVRVITGTVTNFAMQDSPAISVAIFKRR